METLRKRHLKKLLLMEQRLIMKLLLFIEFYDALMKRQGEVVNKKSYKNDIDN